MHPLRARALRAISAFTSPLLPDDYLELINPLWSTRELRGRVEELSPRGGRRDHGPDPPRPRLAGARAGPVPADRLRRRRHAPLARLLDHLRPRPPRRLHLDHPEAGRRGQGLARTSTASCGPARSSRSPTSRASSCSPSRARSGSCSSPPAAGSRRSWRCCAASSARTRSATSSTCTRRRTPDDVIFGERMRELDRAATRACACTIQHTRDGDGGSPPSDLDELCPDWRERETFLCGPAEMLDDFERRWEDEGLERAPAHGALPAGDRRRRRRGRRGRHDQVPKERRRGRERRQPADPRRRRGGRARARVRLPDGDLPHLRRQALLGQPARHAQRRGPRRGGEIGADLRQAPEGPVEIEL